MSTYTVYQKPFYAGRKSCSVLLKAEFNINRTNSLRAGQTCPISFVARGMVKNETERSRITLNDTNIT